MRPRCAWTASPTSSTAVPVGEKRARADLVDVVVRLARVRRRAASRRAHRECHDAEAATRCRSPAHRRPRAFAAGGRRSASRSSVGRTVQTHAAAALTSAAEKLVPSRPEEKPLGSCESGTAPIMSTPGAATSSVGPSSRTGARRRSRRWRRPSARAATPRDTSSGFPAVAGIPRRRDDEAPVVHRREDRVLRAAGPARAAEAEIDHAGAVLRGGRDPVGEDELLMPPVGLASQSCSAALRVDADDADAVLGRRGKRGDDGAVELAAAGRRSGR